MTTLLTASLLSVSPTAAPVEADFVLRGATLHDGTGKSGCKGALAIKGDRIVAVGSFAVAGKPTVLDCAGLIVAPGFIDLHTHCDLDPAITEPARRANRNYLMQGVTTVVTGNCGKGPVDVADFLKKVEEGKVGTNVLHLVPHNDLRSQVMKGDFDHPPSDRELADMKRLVDQGMRAGAWGLSTGLWYVPGSFARPDEVVELAKVAALHGGLYATHMRNEEEGLLASVEEALAIEVAEAGLRVHISHLKAGSKAVWGKSANAVALIEAARKKGQAVTADQYPYTAWSSKLGATLIPARHMQGTPKQVAARLDDPITGPLIRKGIRALIAEWDARNSLRFARYAPRREWQGMTLGEVADQQKEKPEKIVVEVVKNGDAYVVGTTMSEEDVRFIMRQPFVATASDGAAQLLTEDTVPHPRSYGTFPRKIGRYALKEKVVTLEQALRSCTGLPADILGLPERGYLRPGYRADVVVFDSKTLRDLATYEKPHQYAQGVRHLFVNGVPVIRAGKYTDALAGKVLRHQESIDDRVRALMHQGRIPGLSLAVVKEGKVVLAKGYGFANVEHSVQAKPQTVYQSASLGKQFTASSIMLLVEEGKLALDDRLSKYLEGTPQKWKDVTLRHLLTHTSGIKDYSHRDLSYRLDCIEAEFLHKAGTFAMDFAPGTSWKYSNTGYVLLGLVIRKVTGQYHGDFLRQRVLQPLGMNDTRVISEADIIPHRAAGYRLRKREVKNQEWVAPSLNTLADGCLYTTVLDLAKWDAALYTEKVLKRSSLVQMWTPAKLTEGKTHPYGFGWKLGKVGAHPVLEHRGTWQGFRAYLVRYPEEKLTVIALANLSTASTERITKEVAGLHLPKLTPPALTPLEEPEPATRKLLLDVLQRLAQGKLTPEGFTPAAQKELFPVEMEDWRDTLVNVGPLKSLVLVGRKEERTPGGKVRRCQYVADFGEISVRIELTLTPEGKITGLDLHQY